MDAVTLRVVPIAHVVASMRKRNISPSIISRVERLNPNGVQEGTRPRGWPRHTGKWNAFEHGFVTVQQYARQWGADAWRNMPKCMKRRLGGKRYRPTQEQMEDGPVSPTHHTVAYCSKPPCKCWLGKAAIRSDGSVLVFREFSR